MYDEPMAKPGVTPTQIIMLMGVLFGLGLLAGAGFAFKAEQPLIAWILIAVALGDVVAFILLWRLNPMRGQDVGLDAGQRDAMLAELQRRHAAGEIDAEALDKARRSLTEQA